MENAHLDLSTEEMLLRLDIAALVRLIPGDPSTDLLRVIKRLGDASG